MKLMHLPAEAFMLFYVGIQGREREGRGTGAARVGTEIYANRESRVILQKFQCQLL